MNASVQGAALCVGTLSCDVTFPNLSREMMQTDTNIARNVTSCVGGSAAKTAQLLSQMGIKASLIANVSGNVFGHSVCDLLAQDGVDLSRVERDCEDGSALRLIFKDEASCDHAAFFEGGSATLAPARVTDDALKEAKLLHIGSFGVLKNFTAKETAALLERAKGFGLTLCADLAGFAPFDPEVLRAALPLLDLFVCTKKQAEAITGSADEKKIFDFFRPFAPKCLVLLEEACVAAMTGDTVETYRVRGAACDGVFMSGAAAALLKGKPLPAAVRTGCGACAYFAEHDGGEAALANIEALADALA